MTRQSLRWPMRAVFLAGIVSGVVTLPVVWSRSPGMLGVNFHVYYLAAEAAIAGGDLYAVAAPGFPGLPYVYPPIVAVAFVPAVVVAEWQLAFVGFTVVNVVAAGGVGVVALRLAARRGVSVSVVDQVLVVGFTMVTSQMVSSLYFGNVNPMLAFFVGLGVDAIDRGADWEGGVGLVVPAVVKVFPGGFLLYPFVRRNWRLLVVAVGVGGALGVLSVVAFGFDTHVAYVTEAVLPRRRSSAFRGGLAAGAEYLSLRRPMSLLLPAHPTMVGVLAVAVVSVVVVTVVSMVSLEADLGSLVGAHTIVTGVIIALPSYQLYYVFVLPVLAALLLCAPGGRGRQVLGVGAVLGAVPVQVPELISVIGGVPVVDPVVTTLLTIGTPPLYGLVLTLVGAAMVGRRARVDQARQASEMSQSP